MKCAQCDQQGWLGEALINGNCNLANALCFFYGSRAHINVMSGIVSMVDSEAVNRDPKDAFYC